MSTKRIEMQQDGALLSMLIDGEPAGAAEISVKVGLYGGRSIRVDGIEQDDADVYVNGTLRASVRPGDPREDEGP